MSPALRWRRHAHQTDHGTSQTEEWPTDFNEFLHGLRSGALADEPGDAEVILSGGAPDIGYVDWFSTCYPTTPRRHILVEKFREPPESLPEGVEFVQGSLGNLSDIADGCVDLVFAGQVTEHLWADDLAGFLVAAHRVLAPGGRLVVDSPNRDVTLATGWHMPEHTLELAPSEARELLGLSGFDIDAVRGLWLCADPIAETPLPLLPQESPAMWPISRRIAEAHGDPDHSFVWWATATRGGKPCDDEAVQQRCREIFSVRRRTLFGRLIHPMLGRRVDHGGRPAVLSDDGAAGYVLIGPFVAMPPGRQSAVFTFVFPDSSPHRRGDPDATVASIDVSVGDERRVVAERSVRARDLPDRGQMVRIGLSFELPETTFGCETRVRTTGLVPIEVLLAVDVLEDLGGPPRLERLPESGLA